MLSDVLAAIATACVGGAHAAGGVAMGAQLEVLYSCLFFSKIALPMELMRALTTRGMEPRQGVAAALRKR